MTAGTASINSGSAVKPGSTSRGAAGPSISRFYGHAAPDAPNGPLESSYGGQPARTADPTDRRPPDQLEAVGDRNRGRPAVHPDRTERPERRAELPLRLGSYAAHLRSADRDRARRADRLARATGPPPAQEGRRRVRRLRVRFLASSGLPLAQIPP